MAGASAFGQRVFVVPMGQTPTLGQTYTIDAKLGEPFTGHDDEE